SAASATTATERRIERVAAANDDVAHFADQTFVLAALVVRRAPTKEVRVERHALLIVRHAEREVVEPDRFPTCRVEGRRRSELGGSRRATRLDVAACIANLKIESVRILDAEAFKPLAVVCRHRIQPALAQLGLDRLRVPLVDHETK